MNKVKLGELLQIKHGFAFKSERYVDRSKYALVTLANISATNNFQFNIHKTTFYGADFPKDFILQEDDLIMPLTEQVIGLFGNTAFVPHVNEFNFVLNQRVGKIIPIEGKADKYYLHYLLATEGVKNQLEYRASGTRQRNISPTDVYDVEVFLPDIEEQRKIGKCLYDIEKKINTNNKINDNLAAMIKTIYEYWFVQFEFPDENGMPYKSSGGKMVWNEQLKRTIPQGWAVASIINNPLCDPIKPGIKPFSEKTYLATADVIGTSIGTGTQINYETRESRANMQPEINSVWFAKMKSSIKHLFLSPSMHDFIQSSILSTGFQGLQCTERSFEYIASFIGHDYFETLKDQFAHGATQEAVNNDDLKGVKILIPDKRTLDLYHSASRQSYQLIGSALIENKHLVSLRDWLIPMLMNGQATIED